MLSFTTTPGPCAAAGQRAEYRLASTPAQTVDIRITDSETGELLGTKRFAEVTEAVFDAAPVVRRCIGFDPHPSNTSGFLTNADRIRTIKVTAAAIEAPENEAAAPECRFYPASKAVQSSSLLTAMPRERLIAPGEQDELTVLNEGNVRATVTAAGPGGEEKRTYVSRTAMLHIFRLCADDFPGAEQITVDFGTAGTVVYSVTARPDDACRIAWRSRAGSLEHYTFPTETVTTVEASKTRVCSSDGYSTAATAEERRTRLRSAYETRATAEALTETISSPEVWRIADEGYEAVDVATDTAQLQRQGVLNVLEIEIRSRKTGRPWR